jgi:hypothetical protein
VQLSIIRIGWSSTSARMTPLLCCWTQRIMKGTRRCI